MKYPPERKEKKSFIGLHHTTYKQYEITYLKPKMEVKLSKEEKKSMFGRSLSSKLHVSNRFDALIVFVLCN